MARIRNETWRQVLDEPGLVVWAIYIFLIPIYIFKSGLPQPGDVFILILVPMVLWGWNGRLPAESRSTFRALMWFTLWVCLVNYTWMIVSGNFTVFGPDSFVLYPIYYIYNALIFLCAVILYRRHGELFLRVTTYVVLGTVFVQALSSAVFRTGGLRGSLFFNNPNQLGYYALLAGTLIAFTHRRLKIRLLTSSAAMLSCGYLAMISASRAAVGGIAVLMALLVFSNPRVIIAACVATFLLIGFGGPIADAIDSSQDRVINRGRNSGLSFLEERGYDRIWKHEEYLLFGAGEGGLSRWDDTSHVRMMEIHSSAGTVLFSYGAVGSILFLIFAWRVIRGASFGLTLLLLPPLLYTIAHHGLRFTMLWIVLAVFLLLKRGPPARASA